MREVFLLSYTFLSISSLLMLRARKFTRLYPLAVVSSLMYVLAALDLECRPILDLTASICIYVVAYHSVRNGFLTYEGFTPPLFDRRVTAFGLILIALSLIGGDPILVASRVILANTFAILALSRRRTPIRVGDYEALMLASYLILAEAAVMNMANAVVDVHLLYTASLLFMLTMLRR